MKRMGNEKYKFIGRWWNGEPQGNIWFSRKELYFDEKNNRYILINEQGIDCWPKIPMVEYLDREEAEEFALNKLSYTEWNENFGG